jgi:hypothetical protein
VRDFLASAALAASSSVFGAPTVDLVCSIIFDVYIELLTEVTSSELLNFYAWMPLTDFCLTALALSIFL